MRARRSPASRALAAARRPAEPRPPAGGRVSRPAACRAAAGPAPLRAGELAPPLHRAIGRCYRLRELPLVRGRGPGRAPRGLHNRGRVGGCKGSGVPYITRGSGEGGSRPIPAKQVWPGGRQGRAAQVSCWASRRRGLRAVGHGRAGSAQPTGEWNWWYFWVRRPLGLPRALGMQGFGVPIVLIFPKLAAFSHPPV